MRPLSEKEVDVVYKWLGVSCHTRSSSPSFHADVLIGDLNLSSQFLVNFFHGGGEGVPLEDLRNAKYLGSSFLISSSGLSLMHPWLTAHRLSQNSSRRGCTTKRALMT